MFTHTLYLSISTQSRYLFTHKRPLCLSTVYAHSPNLSLSLSFSLSIHTFAITAQYTFSLFICTHSHSLYTLPLSHSLSISLHTLLLSTSLHARSLYLYTHTLPLCLSATFHVLQFSIGVFLFVVYSVNNINFSRGLDALGINSVCPALCY